MFTRCLGKYLADIPAGAIQPIEISEDLAKYLKTEAVREAQLTGSVHIAACTLATQNWIRAQASQRRIIPPGHDRKDVVSYRQNIYPPQLSALRKKASRWDSDDDKNLRSPSYP